MIAGLKSIDKNSVDTVITSPPYWSLRDYGTDEQIGMESTLEEYHERLLEVTAHLKRVMKPSGVMFWNHGDSYGGSGGSGGDYDKDGMRAGQPKVGPAGGTPKCLTMQNSRLIIKMIDQQGWILRNMNIWYKPNGMPSSARDRFTNKYEPVYMLVKNQKYWFDLDAVRAPYTEALNRWGGEKLKTNGNSDWDEGTGQTAYRDRDMRPNPLGKNPGDITEMTQVEWINYCYAVWDTFASEEGDVMKVPTQPHKDAHFAIFPDKLVEPMIKAGCPSKVCSECGFIPERITEKFDFGVAESDTAFPDGNIKSLSQNRQAWRKMGVEAPPAPETTGYTSCDCDADFEPGVVLDPFAGSGTTMKNAKLLGRSTIGIEISEEYCDIIKRNLLFHQYTFGNIVNKFVEL